ATRSDLNVTGDLAVTANFVITYTAHENWRFLHFGSYDNSGTAADDYDADSDGLVNLIEYATGTDPNSPNGSPVRIRPSSTINGELELIFDRIDDPALVYTVESTSDLSTTTWSPVWTGTGTATESVTIPESLWPAGESRRFFRLGVSY
ncbi:MAG: hypothetical protein ACQCXQ_12130, partial [Verrucomicrobiales bacterium]